MLYEWDETKREANLAKHGLDFSDADLVLESPFVPGERHRIVSFRPAKRKEREAYHAWLEGNCEDK